MAFWNRKKSVENSELPEEVREYYASTKRSRFGAPWLLGLATLLLTLAIAVALYFAGKFVWEQFFTDEAETPTTTEQTTVSEQSEQPSQSENNTSDNDNQTQTTSDQPQTLPADNNDNPEDEVSPSPSREASSQLTSTPETGPGDTVAIFVGTTLVAGLAYEILARKKVTN